MLFITPQNTTSKLSPIQNNSMREKGIERLHDDDDVMVCFDVTSLFTVTPSQKTYDYITSALF